MNNQLILSLFPGVDLLAKPFIKSGFSVVRGPDIAFGEDIREFNPVKGRFDGIIGGSPCQDFSLLNRTNPTGNGLKMIDEFIRCVNESDVDWFLFENVPTAPGFKIPGYKVQRFELDLGWYTNYTRLRHFQFGSKNGRLLNPPKLKLKKEIHGGCVTASGDDRSFRQMCDIQGLPDDYDLPHFSKVGKKAMVGNGVPLQLGTVLVDLILRDYYQSSKKAVHTAKASRRCLCGCGRVVIGRKKYFEAACRKRASRARKRSIVVTQPDPDNYLGSKSGAGVKETIINMIPPHMTYIEGFLGTGAIMKAKRPAVEQIAIDLNEQMLDQFKADFPVKKLCEDVYRFLRDYPYNGTEFIYLDPPYLEETRSSNIRYKHEYSLNDHKNLLELITTLEVPVLISGYGSDLYDSLLSDWNRKEFVTMSRGGKRTEVLWWNYDLSSKHDSQFTGKNKTNSQSIKRKVERWTNKFDALPHAEQQILLEKMLEKFKSKITHCLDSSKTDARKYNNQTLMFD